MHPNAALIARFYEAFARKDAEAMAKCYHDEIIFHDPAFGELRGERARNMWRMLAARATDLRLEVSGIGADDRAGRARWVAHYSFGPAKRPVVNRIDAAFEFKDGLIARHTDSFDLWRWSRQALGAPGILLGWSPIVKRKVRAQALAGLDAFEAKRRG